MLERILQQHQPFQPVILYEGKLLPMDFTAANKDLQPEILNDINLFSDYITQQLAHHECVLGIGGYGEHRTIYSRSAHFDTGDEPRRLHLAVDIWGAVGTNVYAPLDGEIHSFRFNNEHGDYGTTIILRHQLSGYVFHTLYGHLSQADLEGLTVNDKVVAGQVLGHFGNSTENGCWPPHLHFQIIKDMEGKEGDYPGVCRYSEREKYLGNCPDPNIILQMI
jgi:murein DD-endopeptidase MepM/ murein hydrolase activator NlpD